MSKLSTSPAGSAGEYYVLAELLRRGYVASTLYGGAKDYDILAYHPESKKHLKIQVKTSQSKALSWKLGDHEPAFDQETFYVFVTLLDLDAPTYYIFDSETVSVRAERRHNTPTNKGTPRSSGRKFIMEKSEISLHKNAWDILL